MHGTESLVDVVLAEMARNGGPQGARVLWRTAVDSGFDVSESTISRVLGELDAQGLTVVVGKKGRELTEAGRALSRSLIVEAERDAQLNEALHIGDPDELLDLLAARRGLERETVRAVALRATEPELDMLAQLTATDTAVQMPEHWHERIDFHSYIGSISHNKQLVALTEVAFDRRRAELERLIFLVGMRTGGAGVGLDEHRAIAQAVRGRDADAAELLMVRHIDGIMASVSQFARTASVDDIEGLFRQQTPVTGSRRTLTTLTNNRANAREIGASS